MYKVNYSALLKSGVSLLLFCLIAFHAVQAQSDSNPEDRLDEAMQSFDKSEFKQADLMFKSVVEEYCSSDKDLESCYKARLYRAIIARRESRFAEAREKFRDIEMFVNNRLDGDINKIARIYSNRTLLECASVEIEECGNWAKKLRTMESESNLSPFNTAVVHNSIGHYESEAGNYSAAITSYLKSIENAQPIDDLDKTGRLLIQVYNNLGISYRRVGEIESAMEYYQKSLKSIRKVHGDVHLQVGTAYNNIGTIYYIFQDLGQAADYFARAAGIIEKILGPNHVELGAPLNNAALCYYSLGNYELAVQYLERAQTVKVASLGEDHPETAIGFSNLAAIYIQNENYSRAEENYLRSISIRRNALGDNHPDLIDPIIRLGTLYSSQMQNQKGARTQFRKALDITFERLGESHPHVANAYLLIGETYYEDEYYSEALYYYRRSMELLYGEYNFDENPDLDRHVTDPVKLVRVLQYKSRLLREKPGEFDEHYYKLALKATDWATDLVDQLQMSYKNEASKLRLVDQNYSLYTDAIEIMAALYDESGDEQYIHRIFDTIEKSRSRVALELIQKHSARNFAGVREAVLENETALNTRITQLQQRLFREQEKGFDQNNDLVIALQDSVFSKKRELEQFTRDLETEHPTYYMLKYDQSVLTLNDAQQLLSDSETIVSYTLGANSIYALVITSKDATILDLGSTEESFFYLQRIRTDVAKGKTEEYINTAHSLYERIFKPVEPYISGEEIIIVADQQLHYLPFEVLLTERPDHEKFHQMPYLLRKYTFSYIPSATMLNIMTERRPANPRNLLAVAPFSSEIIRPEEDEVDVQYATTVEPLLLTKYETQSISGLFIERRSWGEYIRPHNTKILFGSDATMNRFSSIDLKEYNFIHFATHAFVNEQNPEFSGIMLYPDMGEDGIAYVGDIYNMEFNADLVVLGACETGLGSTFRGEGLIGFTRAFIYAGASNLLVSMWKVNDQPTAYLMIDFYDYIRDGYSYNEALRRAKLNIINRPHMADPVNWAAFILTGR